VTAITAARGRARLHSSHLLKRMEPVDDHHQHAWCAGLCGPLRTLRHMLPRAGQDGESAWAQWSQRPPAP